MIVNSKIHFYKNPKCQLNDDSLALNGVELELISILLDGDKPDYELTDEELQLHNLPDEFILEIVNRIHPEANVDCPMV